MTYSQQPPAYTPPPQPGAPLAPPPPANRNVLALIALIVAVVGFIFACIPGALIVGWVLLPIAFVLSLVSLFLKGRGKGLGIAGLIISIVGTIVAFVVFFAVVAASFNDAFSDDTVVIEESTGAAEAPAEEHAEAEDAAGEAGSRDNPVAVGATIASEDWTVVINSVNADGNAVVAEANQFNDTAPAGSHYEIVNYTVTYTGEDSSIAAEVGVDMVTSAGNVINSYDTIVSLNDSISLDELFNGASATGSAAFAVPDGETALVRVRPGILADDVFVKP
ncbi:hypothetical protein [Herbiconiux sp. A18JL235]|uniref:DUF4352 domain-containing protein n=1 Tax=Herbiconiux sp. A18JL235 TaxID=3152363 RepID=A0AB39BL86_9MICO